MRRKMLQYWDSAPPPRDVQALIDETRRLNPGWEHALFDRAQALAYLRGHFDPEVAEAFAVCALPAMQSDFFRYYWLLREGGLYVDADELALAPFDTVLADDPTFVASWNAAGDRIQNNFIYCAPGDPAIRRAAATALANVQQRAQGNVWRLTGPAMLHACLERTYPLDDPGLRILSREERAALLRVQTRATLGYKREGLHWRERQRSEPLYTETSGA